MAIQIKSTSDIVKMREAGRIVGEAHNLLQKYMKPGITTNELNNIANDYIKSQGAIASFLNYRGYPKSICISINDEIIHGIPGKRKLQDGDIVSIDIGAYKDGFHGDAARTWAVGSVSPILQKLIDVTEQSFFQGIKFATAEYYLNDICSAIQKHVEDNGFSVVLDYVGHGIGKELHESPEVPNYKCKMRGPRLCSGMTLAIEPMVNEGTYEIEHLDDDWTVVTEDGKFSAHYENTVLITDGEPEILTLV